MGPAKGYEAHGASWEAVPRGDGGGAAPIAPADAVPFANIRALLAQPEHAAGIAGAQFLAKCAEHPLQEQRKHAPMCFCVLCPPPDQ